MRKNQVNYFHFVFFSQYRFFSFFVCVDVINWKNYYTLLQQMEERIFTTSGSSNSNHLIVWYAYAFFPEPQFSTLRSVFLQLEE